MPALRSQTPCRARIKLIPASAEDYRFGDKDSECDCSQENMQPKDIEEPWPYVFRRGDNVWIKICGKWFPGRIWGHRVLKGPTHDRQTEGLYFCVYFWGKARKFVSPLNGDVKPDTVHIHKLLKDAGSSWVNVSLSCEVFMAFCLGQIHVYIAHNSLRPPLSSISILFF